MHINTVPVLGFNKPGAIAICAGDSATGRVAPIGVAACNAATLITEQRTLTGCRRLDHIGHRFLFLLK